MDKALKAIEDEISRLRREMRGAAAGDDSTQVDELRVQLHQAEKAWDALFEGREEPRTPPAAAQRAMKPAREMTLQTLDLIGAPASGQNIRAVHNAFFGATLDASRMASLRRDEERSYQIRGDGRIYVCPALTAGSFRPARSVLASSAWPLERRLLASGSEQVNYLIMAARLAEATTQADVGDGADRSAVEDLLHRLALNIPGLAGDRRVAPDRIRSAASTALDRLLPDDRAARTAAARACQLDTVHQLFGAPVARRNS